MNLKGVLDWLKSNPLIAAVIAGGATLLILEATEPKEGRLEKLMEMVVMSKLAERGRSEES